ncbi:glycosyltransferase family 4 protein [Flavobacterium turcicum]|uniref:glycosyltransferase family 4 protein n=1 Tax=Flavobacterium turcicum TaxID=2764718 RepID=UPI001CEC756F|nr:glycosyltransferase family 4 protein [Flavobacterium turcicum]
MKLLIVTQVPHVQKNGHYYSYAPYIDEMNIWGQFVSHITVVAPCSKAEPTAIDKEYQHPDVKFTAVPAINLLSILSVFKVMVMLPLLLWRIAKSMNQADHIHLRCPGNMGLLGSIVQMAFPSKPKTAKYAGNWDPTAKQPWSYRLQKWILSNTFLTRHMQVLVYGEWPGSSTNIKSFFTASYAAAAAVDVEPKSPDDGISFIFVGALVKGKNPLYAIKLVQEVARLGFAVQLKFYGEGPERSNLEHYIDKNDLKGSVVLYGNQNKATVQQAYQNSHFVILPSQSEGWPKALAEGMFWGCVPMGTAVSCVPTMLDHGQRGVLLELDADADSRKIASLLKNEKQYFELQMRAMAWSRNYTTDSFAKAIQGLLSTPNDHRKNHFSKALNSDEKVPIRIMQLIDSLEAGGAERMAVSYANALSKLTDYSALVVTRKEGPLQDQLDAAVPYFFLRKKRSIDLKAVWRLKGFVKKNRIQVLQAHSTSFFTAVLLKYCLPSLQIIWHDHYGDSEFLKQRPATVLKYTAPFFSGVITVNQKLKNWCESVLKVPHVLYLPNFTIQEKNTELKTKLLGLPGKRILCLANLRPQKDQQLLLEVANKLRYSHPEWTFHLVGKDFEDEYAATIKKMHSDLKLEKNVFLYGSKTDVAAIIQQVDIAILTSKSEGLPVALLEYGAHKKAVVVTNVGEVQAVVQNGLNGLVMPAQEVQLFYDAIVQLIENSTLRDYLGQALYDTVQDQYAEKSVMTNYLNWLKNILK